MSRAVDITSKQRRILLDLFKKHLPDTIVWAYGSRVRWTSNPYSDLDIIAFAKHDQEEQVHDLREALEESNLPFRVDLFVWDEVPDKFRKNINAEHAVLTGDKGDTHGWQEVSIKEVAEIVGGGTPQRSRPDYWGGNIPWLSIKDLNDESRYVYDTKEHISESGLKNSSTEILPDNSLIISARGTVGKLAQLLCPMAFNQSCYGIKAKPEMAHNDYLYYLLKFRAAYLKNISHGSVFDTITRSTFEDFKFLIPNLTEQIRIANILGSLDDKIELNRKMNETLEATAQLLFKDWFVDFGPTRAKMAGQEPYFPPEIWDLFPDKFNQDGIPDGWKVGKVCDYFHLTMGQSPPGHSYNDEGEGLPFFQGRTNFGFRYPDNQRFCTEPARIAEPDDTLISVRAPVGDINMARERYCIGRGIAALRHKSGSCSFTYYSARSIQQEMRQYEHTGTVFGAINKQQFESLAAIEPSQNFVSLFQDCVGPIDEHIKSNVLMSQYLYRIRDLLLQKLMSGEIRIEDVEVRI